MYSIDDIKLVHVNPNRKESDANKTEVCNSSIHSNSIKLKTKKILVPASNFDFNNSKLNKFAEAKFLNSIQYIDFNDIDSILIEGHTSTGNEEYNLRLSMKRGKTIKDLLESKSDCNRLIIAFPLKSNETREGRAKNRRIEIEIFYSCEMQKNDNEGDTRYNKKLPPKR